MEQAMLNNIWPEWQVVKQLGRGSFGVVYEAVRNDHSVESHAAIKVISIPQNESEIDSLRSEGLTMDATKTYFQNVVDDFVNEIQLMESFKGIQNIVSVEDYKVVEKTDEIGWDIYIRMELLMSFNEYVCDKKLTEQEVIKLGIDICTALEVCTKRNVIHRDIKPENIFVNAFGDFKLGDFGIARKLENVTGGLSQKGTYNYMAPEIEKGTRYDATVDLYSLGLVLYRLMNNNRLPFLNTERQLLNPNERMTAIRRRLNGETLPAPCEASEPLAQIILCACSHNPAKRFASATAMKNALMSIQNVVNMAKGNVPDATVSVRHTAQAQNVNQTTSVQKPSQNKENQKKTVDTFGPKKKSKIPIIAAVVCILAFFVGGGIFAIQKIGLLRDDESMADAESSEVISTTKPKEDGYEDEEEIRKIVKKAEKYAGNEGYERALKIIKNGLMDYPESEELLELEEKYTIALAKQEEENEEEMAEETEATEETASRVQTGNITELLFDSSNFDNELKPAKDTYGNTFGKSLTFSNNNFVVYDLRGNYRTFKFTIANSENMVSGKKCVIQFWGDGKLIYTSNYIDYYSEPKEVKLNVLNISKLKIKHFYEYDSWQNPTAGDALIANINLGSSTEEQYDNIDTYQGKYMLEEIKLFNGAEIISNPLILDSYGNQYECAYSFTNNSSSELLLNGEYTRFKGKIVPSELMNSEKECQIVIETDTNSQTFDVNYYTEPIEFDVDLSDSKFLRIKHFYEYDSWLNATAGDAMLVNCYLEK